MSEANLFFVLLPPSGVCDGQPLHERPQVSIMLRPHHKMPVIGHDTVRADSQEGLFQRFGNNVLERQVIVVAKEELLTADTTIDDVERHSSRSDSCRTGHPQKINDRPRMSIYVPVPFLSSPRFRTW